MMFELEVRRTFSAAHAIVIRGQRERVHGHDWHVEVVVAGITLDEDGLLCDFHQLEADLDEVLRPMQSSNLNETPPFDTVNPTAEAVARFIGVQMASRLAKNVQLRSVRVTEAPGCAARYVPLERS